MNCFTLRALRLALFAASGFAVLLLAATTRADERACLEAYEEGQLLHQRGKLIAAQRALRTCAQPDCPALVGSDCTSWLAQVSSALPAVTFSVTDRDGGEIGGVQLYADGRALRPRGEHRSVNLDPGSYRLRCEATGFEPQETTIDLREADKRNVPFRLLPVSLPAPATPTAAQAVPRPEPVVEAPDSGRAGRLTSALYLSLGGATLAGLGLFTYFAVAGANLNAKLDACDPRCERDQAEQWVGDRQRSFLIADVSVIVAGASAAALLVLYLADRNGVFASAYGRMSWRVASSRYGASLSWSARF